MQEIVVGIVVFWAAIAVLLRYLPKSLKQLARSRSARIAIRLGWHAFAARIERQAESGASCGNGCGSCGNCDSSNITQEKNSSSISVEALKRTISN